MNFGKKKASEFSEGGGKEWLERLMRERWGE